MSAATMYNIKWISVIVPLWMVFTNSVTLIMYHKILRGKAHLRFNKIISVSPPTLLLICGTHDIAGHIQKSLKKQQIQLAAIFVSIMLTIGLLYFWYKFYIATIKHRKALVP